jgi:esterase/lipase
MSELSIFNNNKIIIVTFGGLAMKIGLIPPFEFLNFLNKNYCKSSDLLFFIDVYQCWYHNGLKDYTKNIDETIEYINNKIKNYEKVIFMGCSAGGYASILFGSLCKNVHSVVAYSPQTYISKNRQSKFTNEKYIEIKNIFNDSTNYYLMADENCKDISHSIEQINRVEEKPNIKKKNCPTNMKILRDSGKINEILDKIINNETIIDP